MKLWPRLLLRFEEGDLVMTDTEIGPVVARINTIFYDGWLGLMFGTRDEARLLCSPWYSCQLVRSAFGQRPYERRISGPAWAFWRLVNLPFLIRRRLFTCQRPKEVVQMPSN